MTNSASLPLLSSWRQCWQYRHLVFQLAYRDLRLRYDGGLLGVFLATAKPLLVVFFYLFGLRAVLHIRLDHYPLFLACGFLHWNLLTSWSSSACNAVTRNLQLVHRANFPRVVLVLSAALSEGFSFLLTFALFLLLYPFLGGKFWAGMLLYPLGFALYSSLLLGLGFAFAAVQVIWTDFRAALSFALSLFFWLTPVVYATWHMPRTYQPWLRAVNPITPMLEFSRSLFYSSAFPEPQLWFWLTLWAGVALVLGWTVFSRLQRRFAEFV